MRYSVLVAAFALSACATSHVPPPEAEAPVPTRFPDAAAMTAADTTMTRIRRLDSVKIVTPPSGWSKMLGKIGLAPRPRNYATMRVGKKSTIQNFYAAATLNTVEKKGQLATGSATIANTDIGKKAEPAVVNSAAATQTTAQAGAQQTTTTGDNNDVKADKHDTTQEALGVGASIAKAVFTPIGGVLAAALLVGIVYGIYRWRQAAGVASAATRHDYPDNGQPS